MVHLIRKAPFMNLGRLAIAARPSPALLLAGALLVLVTAGPGFAQRCTTQNGQTICCDNSGNC